MSSGEQPAPLSDSAAEVELFLSKALPEGPSATAIQNAVRKRPSHRTFQTGKCRRGATTAPSHRPP
jgi:hypothetical protein